MPTITIEPIGYVQSEIKTARDEHWGAVIAEIALDHARFEPVALHGLSDFSHVEVLFMLDQVQASQIENRCRHPRNNPIWPKVGIFAQRGRTRPSRIGTTICELLAVTDLTLRVRGLDAFDGSPVLDLKPVMSEFLPEKTAIRQPAWSRELMSTYFT